ncbi:sensor histidine kinase [Shimazuella kribbensis]|uniref:sensor histidine kinase n=1 Tax=Shimazuella kribbensis TaxID=139808 RepID=UPI00041B319C|nr:sensor histidine kinase [Shimazuella kribbensis]
MKLFLREQISLFVLNVLQLGFMILLLWMDGFHELTKLAYPIFFYFFLLFLYLCYRYLTNRTFYQRLSTNVHSVDAIEMKVQLAPLSQSLGKLLKNQSELYRKELQSYKDQIDQHIQFMNQWVHQMKTPLAVIDLILQNHQNKEGNAISYELDRLKKGLEMVLYTSRLSTFDRDFFVEKLNLESIVRTVTSDLKRFFIQKKLYPQFQSDNSLTVTSDEKWLSFVVMQIAINAVRYSPKEDSKIIFRIHHRENRTVLEVIDTGVGIPASDLPRVFDAHFTGQNGRNFHESTGMGLFLVKQICQKLNHQVEIESTVSKGTTVRILF